LVWVEVVVGREVEGSDPGEKGRGAAKPRLRLILRLRYRHRITGGKVVVVWTAFLVRVGGDGRRDEDGDDDDVEEDEEGGWG